MNLTIVMYHYVRPITDSEYPRIKGLEFSKFQYQLDYLQSKFEIVTPAEVLSAVNGNTALPENACLLTFDDGYSDHYEYVFPELSRRGLSGIFFPPVGAVKREAVLDVNKVHFILNAQPDSAELYRELNRTILEYSSEEPNAYEKEYRKASRFDDADTMYVKNLLQFALPLEVKKPVLNALFKKYVAKDESEFADYLYLSEDNAREMLSNGMAIGSHGDAHLWLGKLNREQQEAEIDSSLQWLASIGVDTSSWFMGYPFGSWNNDTLELLAGKHCALGFVVEFRLCDLSQDHRFLLPRLDTNDFPQG